MALGKSNRKLHPAWWTLIFLVAVVVVVLLTGALYANAFTSYVPVTVTSDRSGLVMQADCKVMMNGVEVGRVSDVSSGQGSTTVKLKIQADQIKFIPANVGVQIRASTAFGAKFIDLIYPTRPSADRLHAGAVLQSRNVSTEVNTVFESLVRLIDQIDPAKLNSVLGALSQGLRGQGEHIGEAITDANQVLIALNPRSDTVRQDWQALRGASDAYNAAAPDIVSVLDAASTSSVTITKHAPALDSLLLSAISFSQAGTNLLGPNEKNLIDAINILEPTTALLMKYNPEYTCLLMGAKWWLDNGAYSAVGGNGRTDTADATIHLGKDKYNFPDNLPIVAAKGGPGGKPGCGSLPDASKMFPVRYLVTNTGWGTGMDLRPNPGVAAQTCFANFLPVTRAVPEPPDIKECLPGPAVGPVTAPGMPPYGAALYGPGGVPLWPALPPAGTAPPVPVPGTPVAPGKVPPDRAPAIFGEQPPLPSDQPPRPVYEATPAPPPPPPPVERQP
jgi:phospholipid/cholesterol/gamma-HCH transport system substrate-binding protein